MFLLDLFKQYLSDRYGSKFLQKLLNILKFL
ncbi:hypothetical protein E1I18_01605 [Mycoplasmopsis mucosicanis]|uniref:Uncharacterized protein n=1 Tax=Mycoplasmopsis mucosicanis TaxID=458208 RepID=A0A507SK50_9BACT|nr:hypothetical protein E1I18_01605 [Mycoplasmopsis mucosicanis]